MSAEDSSKFSEGKAKGAMSPDLDPQVSSQFSWSWHDHRYHFEPRLRARRTTNKPIVIGMNAIDRQQMERQDPAAKENPSKSRPKASQTELKVKGLCACISAYRINSEETFAGPK